jgi:hypothetical protein
VKDTSDNSIVQGIVVSIGSFSKFIKKKAGRKVIRNLRHTASVTFPCECGRSNRGEADIPLAARLREHRQNLKEGLVENSELCQLAYQEDHRAGWTDGKILETESKMYRKQQGIGPYVMLNQTD